MDKFDRDFLEREKDRYFGLLVESSEAFKDIYAFCGEDRRIAEICNRMIEKLRNP